VAADTPRIAVSVADSKPFAGHRALPTYFFTAEPAEFAENARGAALTPLDIVVGFVRCLVFPLRKNFP
jgi:hypothetical protein